MTVETTKIPRRQKCVNKEHPYIGGSVDIIDDDLQLTQAQINAIVLGGTISVALNFSSSAVDVTEQGSGDATIALTASCSTSANSIKIKKDGTEVASGSGTSLSYTDTRAHSGTPTSYVAEFLIGGMPKSASRNIATIYYGSGDAYTDAKKAIDKVSPAGTYNVTVGTAGTYVWFVVPSTMTINSAKKSGFDFPLEAPVNVTINNESYKAYRSSNTYDAGTESIVLS